MTKLLEGKAWDAVKGALNEGLQGKEKTNFDMVLENTRKEMLRESATFGATGSGNISTLNKVVLPVLRRVMPNVIANNLIGVQAISGPVAQINTLRLQYSDTFGGVTAGQEALSPYDIAASYAGNGDVNNPAGDSTARLEGTPGRKLGVQMLKMTAEVTSRRLSARWTMEAAQDADSQYAVDLESELLGALSQELTQEIDQEILHNLRSVARDGGTYDMQNDAAFTGTPTFVGDRHAVLTTLINREKNEISARTRRGPANWIVVSPNQLTVLQSGTTSAFARTTEGSFESPDNQKKVGRLNNELDVYVDTYAQDSTPLLIGYKGSSETDAGAFYCPYIPLSATQVMQDPNSFEHVVGFMSRYAYVEFTDSNTSFGNTRDYYATINIPSDSLKFI